MGVRECPPLAIKENIMNDTVQKFARDSIKNGLGMCTDAEKAEAALEQKTFELKLCEEFIKGIESAAEEILPGITKTQEDDMEMRGRNIIAAIAKHTAHEAKASGEG